jgi:hypothetical protein
MLLNAVFRFGVRYGLPLHVGRCVGPAALEGSHVVEDVARAIARGLAS